MTKMDDLTATAGLAENVHDIMAARMTRTSPVLEEAWRYWSSKRRGGDLPMRVALDPRGMQLILGHSMILDRVRPGTVRVRLGGRVPAMLMGMETRGLPIRAFFDLLQRGEAADLIDAGFDGPATLELDLLSEGPDGALAARMLVLPLLDTAGAVTKALAVIVPDRLTDGAPRRFRIVRHHLGATAQRITAPVVPTRRENGTGGRGGGNARGHCGTQGCAPPRRKVTAVPQRRYRRDGARSVGEAIRTRRAGPREGPGAPPRRGTRAPAPGRR